MKKGLFKASEVNLRRSKQLVTKWHTDLDRKHQTVSWHDCDTISDGGKKTVKSLKCAVCNKFKASIRGRCNSSKRWIVSSYLFSVHEQRQRSRSVGSAHTQHAASEERARNSCRPRSHLICPYCAGTVQTTCTRERLAQKEVGYIIHLTILSKRLTKIEFVRTCVLA